MEIVSTCMKQFCEESDVSLLREPLQLRLKVWNPEDFDDHPTGFIIGKKGAMIACTMGDIKKVFLVSANFLNENSHDFVEIGRDIL